MRGKPPPGAGEPSLVSPLPMRCACTNPCSPRSLQRRDYRVRRAKRERGFAAIFQTFRVIAVQHDIVSLILLADGA
jgi:hypothetical protein